MDHEMETTERRAVRRRVLKSGTIAYNDRFKTLSCTVRDLSEGGARLRADNPLFVPSQFELLIEQDGFEAECEVVWRVDKDLGVRFTSPPRQRGAVRRQAITAVVPENRSILRRKPLDASMLRK